MIIKMKFYQLKIYIMNIYIYDNIIIMLNIFQL